MGDDLSQIAQLPEVQAAKEQFAKTQPRMYRGIEIPADGIIRKPLADVLDDVFAKHPVVMISDGAHLSPVVQNSITLASQRFTQKYKEKGLLSLEVPGKHQDKLEQALAGTPTDVFFLTQDIHNGILLGANKAEWALPRLTSAQSAKSGVIFHDVPRQDKGKKDIPLDSVNDGWIERSSGAMQKGGYTHLLMTGGELHFSNPKRASGNEKTAEADIDELWEKKTGTKPFYIRLLNDAQILPTISPGDSDIYRKHAEHFRKNNLYDTPDLLISFGEFQSIEAFDRYNTGTLSAEMRLKQTQHMHDAEEGIQNVRSTMRSRRSEGLGDLADICPLISRALLGRDHAEAQKLTEELQKETSERLNESAKREGLEEYQVQRVMKLEKQISDTLEDVKSNIQALQKLNAPPAEKVRQR